MVDDTLGRQRLLIDAEAMQRDTLKPGYGRTHGLPHCLVGRRNVHEEHDDIAALAGCQRRELEGARLDGQESLVVVLLSPVSTPS